MFKHLNVRSQLLFLAFLMSFIVIWIGTIGLRNMNRSNMALSSVYSERVVPIRSLKIVGDTFAIDISSVVYQSSQGGIDPEILLKNIRTSLMKIDLEWKKYFQGASHRTGDEEREINQLETQMSLARKHIAELELFLSAGGQNSLDPILNDNLFASIVPISGLVSSLIDRQLQHVNEEFELAGEEYAYQSKLSIIYIFFGSISVFVLVYIVMKKLMYSLKKLSHSFKLIATGQANLTQRIEINRVDEVSEVSTYFNHFMDNLEALIKGVQRSGDQVNISSTEIAETSEVLNSTIQEFGNFTKRVGSTAKEISARSQELVSKVKDVSEVATRTANLATGGQSDLTRMENTMSQMESASSEISSRLEIISEKAANITAVVTTITKIADQTNLLSLNASIEAEKAGEYGLGFAVVAREIRRLADQVALATLDIEQMVKEMKTAVSAGVMEMDKFSKEVHRDVKDVRNIGSQLAEIIYQVQTLLPSFDSVNKGVQAQAYGAEEINTSMIGLTSAVDETTASLGLSKIAIGELQEAAKDLKKEVERFKTEGSNE